MVSDPINKPENKILTYESVEISFGGRTVVQDVNFSLKSGEILGLVGESGSGKSTLIKAAMGLLGSDGLVTKGDIRYMGQNILDIPEKEKRKVRGAKIGMINCFAPPYTKENPSPEDLEAVRMTDGLHNRWWLDVVAHGHLPQDVLDTVEIGRAHV